MSKLSDFIKANKESIYLFAEINTPKNDDGKAIITKDDEWNNIENSADKISE